MTEEINNIKTPNDVLKFMKKNIRYGWLDSDNNEHIMSLKGFRKFYRTLSLDDVLKYKLGTCIEQVFLMKYLFDKINIESHMYCTRVYEDSDFSDDDSYQYKCYKELVPIDIVEVHYKDFSQYYEVKRK